MKEISTATANCSCNCKFHYISEFKKKRNMILKGIVAMLGVLMLINSCS